MNNYKQFEQIIDKIKVYVEDYLDGKYPGGNYDEMPNIDEVDDMAQELNYQLLAKYPELSEILNPKAEEGEIKIAYFGSGFLIFALLAGSLFGRCNNRNRCHSGCCCGRNCRCGCGRNCRCGTGCRRC